MASASVFSQRRGPFVPPLPPLSSTRAQRMLATAAKELGNEARDGLRTAGSSRGANYMPPVGVSLDLDGPRRFSLSARSSMGGSRTPRDLMASGPQHLMVATARQPRKGVHAGACSPEDREDHELHAICEQIALKAAQKFSTVREAFRYLDADHDGKISRSEIQYFFRAYNFSSQTANRFFDRLERDHCGAVEYADFVKYVVPHLQPEPAMSEWCSTPECSSNASTRTPSPLGCTSRPSMDCAQMDHPWVHLVGQVDHKQSDDSIDPEIQASLDFIGMKAREKFSHAREAFRKVDCNDDGKISLDEMRYFFRVFNLPEMDADKLFDYMGGNIFAVVDYQEFVRLLGPFLDLPGTQAVMLQRPESNRSSRTPSRGNSTRQRSQASSIADASDFGGELPMVSARFRVTRELTPEELEKEMRDVMKDIGEKLPLKFKHVRDAFRPLDLSHNGKITQTEMRSFLRGFGWTHEVADRFFKALDEDACGEIDFNEFMAHFDAVLTSANRPAFRGELVDVADAQLRQEVNQIAAILGEKLLTKFTSAREALRTLDLSNDGKITLDDMRLFFRTMCMPNDAAKKMFKGLCKDGTDYVDYEDFLALFGPVGKHGGRFRTVQELKGSPRPAIWTIM